jgi:hypothetical protein
VGEQNWVLSLLHRAESASATQSATAAIAAATIAAATIAAATFPATAWAKGGGYRHGD